MEDNRALTVEILDEYSERALEQSGTPDNNEIPEHLQGSAKSLDYERELREAEANFKPHIPEGVIVPSAAEQLNEDGVLDSRTPEEIEKAIIKAQEEADIKHAREMDPGKAAASYFMQLWPLYQARVRTLSNKEARRVCEAVVQWPLEDEKPRFNTQEGLEAFNLGVKLIDCKTVIRDAYELQRLNREVAADEVRNDVQTVEQVFEKSVNNETKENE